MDFTFFDVSEDDADRRLDKVLKCILESHNAKDTNVFSLVRKNLVKLNGKKSKAEVHVKSGDRLEVASFLLGEKKEIEKSKKNADVPELNIVFENEHLLIINKPAGLNVQPSKENGECLSSYVESYYASKNVKKSLSFTPGPLHRIDRFTRGLVCFSMSLKGARWFSENLAEHKIKKTYRGVMEGHFGEIGKKEHFEDLIDDSNEYHQTDGFHTVKAGTENGKYASTFVTPVEYKIIKGTEVTVAEFEIETGRKHQIRAQSALHGHPLYADKAYGSSYSGNFDLCAFRLEFPENDLGIPAVVLLD